MMANLQALDSGDMYTVGWISALPLELAAATAMLDEEHDTPTDFNRSPSDQNNYTFGRMGEHNLVIASLPAGIYGTIFAATTAQHMLSSFPNIRIGLMVGIGAGIPRLDSDIRLGDVVVSQPDGTCGGVAQYDLGKAKADRSFERKGMLNMPPLVLLNALSSLQARHIKSVPKVPQYLDKMLEQYPLMKRRRPKTPSYIYQGNDHDKLFEPMYRHMGGPSCTACDPAREIPRDARDSTHPEIHYGIIASGNTLVKDAVQRDKLAKDSGEECICFEMEAAGLMNTFPCVVIRGICDYADSHKNDRWQGYAAATAAAFAKELLEVIPCADIQRTGKAIEILHEVRETVVNTDENVNKLCGYALSDRLSKWLHAPDPSINYNRAIHLRHPGTGLWFLQSEAFVNWKVEGNGFLWLHGLAGCGKTVLSSIVIEHLQKEPTLSHINLLYFFFDFSDEDKQSHENMLRRFIQQLYVQEEASRHPLERLCERYADRDEQPSLTSLEETFASMLTQAAHTRIVIDALDESCQQKNTLEWLRRISADQSIAPYKLNVIVASRREYDIETAFLKWMPERHILPIRTDDVNKDISNFVQSQIQLDPRLERWRNLPDVQIEIESRLVEKASGMFRWVTCQLDTLENCLDLKDLRNALDDLPDGLDETYSRILARVDARNQEKAIVMLQLLVWGLGEFTLNQLVDALAIRQGEGGLYYDPRNKLPVPIEIVKILPGLVILDAVDHWSGVEVFVRLAHLSVREYLSSDCIHETFKPSLEKLNANIALSDMCIAQFYNSYSESRFWHDLEEIEELNSKTRDLPYFISYSRWWAEHARIAQTDERALERIVKLLTTGLHPGSPCARCIRMTDKKYFAIPREEIGDMTALFFASLCGLDRVVSRLLEHDAQTIDDTYTYVSRLKLTALGAATYNCHEETVRVLLANGATPIINTPPFVWGDDEGLGDPNETASALRILRMLLGHGGKPTFLTVAYATEPLENIRLIQFLLENGAPIKNNDVNYTWVPASTLLHLACEESVNEDMIKLILDHGAEIDALDEEHRTALDVADTEIRELLLDRGADVTASRYEGCTPLHGAVRYQCQEKTVSLLNSGAAIDAQNERGQTALHIAALSVRTSASWFVEELLSRGANALIKDNSGASALDALEGRTCAYGETDNEEHKARIRSMLSKAMSEQSRSAEAVS